MSVELQTPPPPAPIVASSADEASGPTLDASTSATEPRSQRKRAEEAQSQAQRLREQVDELQRSIADAREALDNAERRHRIDLSLIEAGAIDLESARLLTEIAVAHMAEPDIAEAVADLRRTKPFLFRARPAPGSAGATMSPAPTSTPDPELACAAEDAARTGDRKSLLRYLRARRAG